MVLDDRNLNRTYSINKTGSEDGDYPDAVIGSFYDKTKDGVNPN